MVRQELRPRLATTVALSELSNQTTVSPGLSHTETVSFSFSLSSMPTKATIQPYIDLANRNPQRYDSDNEEEQDPASSLTTATATTAFSTLDLGGPVFNATSHTSDPYAVTSMTSNTPDVHAVSETEAQFYYAGLPSEPTLLYRTGKEWSPPTGPEAYRRLKELREVFNHPITKVWNHDLGWRVVEIMEAHKVHFTTIDVIRFKMVKVDEAPEDEEDVDEEAIVAKKPVVGPVTIWIGVFPESTSATVAHDAAQAVLALLNKFQITDVDVDFRESCYMRESGPRLLKPVDVTDPLVDLVSPLTPALGLGISTKARPDAQGTMALYLTEGGDSNNLLGLTCRHVLLETKEEDNLDYVHHTSGPSKEVLLLGNGAFTGLLDSINRRITGHRIRLQLLRDAIETFEEREEGTDAVDVEKAKAKTQRWIDDSEDALEALRPLLDQVDKDWKTLDNRVLGHILYSPAISLGVGEQRFTEDWGVFKIDRDKLGDGFQGNKMDLGTKLTGEDFTMKCFPRADANWEFRYPKGRLLPLTGIINDDLMRTPDMWDLNGEPCLLVIKSGNTTNTTIGRATGVFSIVRKYFNDMSIHQTSMEWCIANYDNKSEVFSEPGDSGSVIADIRGRIGGMLTGGAGKTNSSDLTYATPFWWLLERIRAKFPNAHLGVVAQTSRHQQ